MQNIERKNIDAYIPESLSFERYTTEDGLSQNTIFCIFQDSKGFIWAGMWNGMSRFDGYQFVTFKYDFLNPQSISENKVNSIIETKDGEMWIGTRDGLNRYNHATNNFEFYKFEVENPNLLIDSYIRTLFEDNNGLLWLGTDRNGLRSFNRETKTFTTYKNDSEKIDSLGNNDVYGICQDNNGNLWIATANGLNKFDIQNGRFEHFRMDEKNPNSLSNNRINSITLSKSGFIWLGTEGGLNKFDPVTEKFTHYTSDKNNPHSLDNDSVKVVYEAKSGTLWVGTQTGLNRFIKETDGFISYKHTQSDPRSLGEGSVLSILEDKQGQLWVGTSIGGLSKYNQKKARFQKFKHEENNPNSISNDNIGAIFEDENKILWIAAKGDISKSLIKYDLKKRKFEDFKGDFDNVISIYKDRSGKVWISTDKGLFYFDGDKQHLSKYEHDAKYDAKFINVIAMQEDAQGYMWLGTKSGELSKFNISTGEVTSLRNAPGIEDNLANNQILDILEDSRGEMWVGSRRSLDRYDAQKQSFKRYEHNPNNDKSLSASDVGAIYEDKYGTLWFGSSSGGLDRFDRETESFKHFGEREGLPNDNVYEILEDGQDHLWVTTDKGLARLNIKTEVIRTFDVSDGLTNDEFNDKAAFKNSEGEMYFGGPDGFVKFNPKDFSDSEFQPPVYLTDIRVLEQPLKNGQNVAEMKELTLSYLDYVVSFEFAALDYRDSKKIQYKWKLEGFDKDWINGKTRRTATYTDLSGGEYLLKVKATNIDGIWGDEKQILKITVTPPFYKTFWFIGLVLMAMGLIVWMIFRYRVNQLRKINQTKTKFTQQLISSQEADRKRLAAELHDGLGQELIIIKNRAMLATNEEEDRETIIKEIRIISETASNALIEVREITNNLRPQLLDRLGLTKAIKSMLKKVSGVIEVEFDIDLIDNLVSKNEEINIYRIVQESINNIIKHSNAENALVEIKRSEKNFLITIKDNGVGFDTAKVKIKSESLGLVGLKERTSLLGGEISINSKIGEGTTIRVSIPL